LGIFSPAALYEVLAMRPHTVLLVGCAAANNDLAKVESLCREALRRSPEDALALEALADIYWKNRRLEEALPLALRTLDIEPNDFLALRIAAHAFFERGDNAAAYDYARRLSVAPPPPTETCEKIVRLLTPLSWIPRFRRLKHRAIARLNGKRASYTKWAQWARDYIANYESQSNMEQNVVQ
jgi:tetratricopeptide (TPR) repeat protein